MKQGYTSLIFYGSVAFFVVIMIFHHGGRHGHRSYPATSPDIQPTKLAVKTHVHYRILYGRLGSHYYYRKHASASGLPGALLHSAQNL